MIFFQTFVIFLLGFSFELLGNALWKGVQDDFEVEIAISPTDVLIPNNIALTMHLSFPIDYNPDILTIKQNILWHLNSFHPFYKLFSENISPIQKLGDKRASQTAIFILEPTRTGSIEVSFLNIPFFPSDPQKKVVQLFTPIFSIAVSEPSMTLSSSESIGNAAPLLPLNRKMPLELSENNRELLLKNSELLTAETQRNVRMISQHSFPWIWVVALIFIALAWISWEQLFNRGRWRKLFEVKKENPFEKALKNVSELEKSQNLISNRKTFYESLSNTMRAYIKETSHLQVLEGTTQELIEEISRHPSFSTYASALLINFLNQTDLVKFGQYEPTKQECEKAIETVKEILRSKSSIGRF